MAFFVRMLTLTDTGMRRAREQPKAFAEIISALGEAEVKLVGAWVTLGGPFDILSIIEADDEKAMRQAAAKLAAKGLYKTKTCQAIPVEEFIENYGKDEFSGRMVEAWFRKAHEERSGGRKDPGGTGRPE